MDKFIKQINEIAELVDTAKEMARIILNTPIEDVLVDVKDKVAQLQADLVTYGDTINVDTPKT